MRNLQSLLGIFALLALAWSVSEDRRGVAWKRAAMALLATFATAVVMLKIPGAARLFAALNDGVDAIAAATRAGTSFVFGYLGGGPLPYELKTPGADFVLALQALPVVLVMSVLTTLLFYWRILPPIVRGFSWLLERTLNVGGAVGLSTAANIFLGMVEAPLFIRPYLASLTRSELFMVMTGGMAGIAGTVLVLYATILGSVIPNAAAHFIIASVLGAPAAILISQIMVPDRGARHTGRTSIEIGPIASSSMDAVVKGTAVGPRAVAQYLRHAHRAGRLGAPCKCDHRRAAGDWRRADHARARTGRRHGSGVLAHGHSLGASGDRRRSHGDENHPQ
jgi:concentrative nucleoside transporter, CNT family